MTQLAFLGLDLVAIVTLVFGLYFPRHHRRDLVVAYLGVNAGVAAVALVLAGSSVGAGLGLGLFGVLSIIRLRSDELSQREVAYYFAALALGLLGGLGVASLLLTGVLMAVIIAVLAIADHPRMFGRHHRRLMVLDRAFADDNALNAHLEQRLGARVLGTSVQRVDLVNETTWVEVRYLLPATVQVPAVERVEQLEVAR